MSRKSFLITGTVQGVGFRPFVFRTAKEYGLKGRAQNTGAGVIAEVEGSLPDIDSFKKKIMTDNPPAAEVSSIKDLSTSDKKFDQFSIVKSSGEPGSTLNIPPDIAICKECLDEIENEENRRYEYPFTTCLNCGPRFSIIEGLPYDRKKVSVSDFKMCKSCKDEYGDIIDRRYHAQPIACPDCGPEYSYNGKHGKEAVKEAGKDLGKGRVIALKGWGGYHLLGDINNKTAVKKIRKLKNRDYKPLALMASSVSAVKDYCYVDEKEERFLKSFRRPIVLLQKLKYSGPAELAAPGNMAAGFMLPYSAVHRLLFKYSGLSVFIATSLNLRGEPTLTDKSLAEGFNDISFLEHNLRISMRSDDSVARFLYNKNSDEKILLRRSRGWVPQKLPLPGKTSCLASGANRNSSFSYGRNGEATPSQYTGDLQEVKSAKEYKKTIYKFKDIWGFKPQVLGCDLHPGYGSTRIFKELAKEWEIPLKRIQHHHAHLAGCAAENKLSGKIIGVAYDGMGYGGDGEILGGEFMVFDYSGYRRIASLKEVPQPGGNMAAKEPWRMAVSYLKESGIEPSEIDLKAKKDEIEGVYNTLVKNINAPLTTSAGRLFDAVAAIVGAVSVNSYTARAPAALESLVLKNNLNEGYKFNIIENKDFFKIDTASIIRGIVRDLKKGVDVRMISSKFHYTVAKFTASALLRIKEKTSIERACLSGGVFCNYYLAPLIKKLLKNSGIKIYTHSLVSPNDNGISYGQAAILSGGIS